MSRPSSWVYVWIFAAAVAGGLVLTPLARRFAARLGVVDSPSARKAHLEPVSLLGGLAIYGGAFVGAWSLVAGARSELKGFFLAGFVLVVFGVQDDIHPLDPWVKLLGEISAALVLVGFGVQVHLTQGDVLDVVLTVVWVVGVVNAMNYQDNINGLCAGLAAVCSLGFFVLAAVTNQYLVAVLAIGLAGGTVGFLPSNYPRARIFMGDAGALFLGLVLAFLGIRLRLLDVPQSSAFFIPGLVLAVPLFDALLVTVSRIRRGVPISVGGTDHTSHRLVRAGLPQWAAVAVLWAVQGVFCLGALGIARLGGTIDVFVIGGAVVVALTAGVLLERQSMTAPLPRGEGRTRRKAA
jgi:UDP-GlcNAc:undecaprenyl-phosphate GlcNAc-1-phosphate transferase